MTYSIRSLSSKQLPDDVFVELVDLIFRPLLPAVVIGISVLCVGTLIALRKGDIAAFALTTGCVFISAARIALIMAYRRRTTGSPLNVAEARVWERRYAVASVALAALIGALNARGLMMEHSINPMLIPMLVTGLIFGYGAGIVTRLAVRPAICVTSLMVADNSDCHWLLRARSECGRVLCQRSVFPPDASHCRFRYCQLRGRLSIFIRRHVSSLLRNLILRFWHERMI